MAQASHGVILIVDFGSQVTQLIARRVREAHVYCEIVPFDKAHIALKRLGRNLKGIILSGGPASVLDRGAPRACPLLFIAGVPILGICYGQQEMAYQLGGKVEAGHNREFGRAWVEMLMNSDLTNGVWPAGNGNVYQVWMSHGDRVVELPPGFVAFGKSENAPFAMIADAKRKFYGVQFHLEVVQTTCGDMIIGNFVRKVCGCDGSWTMANFREQAVKKIRKQVGNGKVICGLSGGVDSTVTAMLIHEAIPGQLVCVFVDNGLLRLNEASEVLALFRDHHNIPLVAVDAGERFLTALSGVSDPKQKRKIIGKLFVDVFAEEAKRIGNAKFLAQGTLYPDVIESVSVTGGPSVTIKSHHNVGGLPKQMKVKLVEPLRELFKDEVRVLGRELGLTETIVGRHPFPGPGLAIRIPGEVTQEKVLLLQLVDAIFIDEIRKAGLYDKIWQAYAALLPVKSVGVMGDERTYQYIAWLRAVTSVDGMTADFYPFKPDFLGRVTNRIVNEVKGINRVGYDYTSKPPGTIELE